MRAGHRIVLLLAVVVSAAAAAPDGFHRAYAFASPPATVRVERVAPLDPQPLLNDAAVIFHDDFRVAPDQNPAYFEYEKADGALSWDPQGGLGETSGAIKAQFEKGRVKAGNLKVLFGKNPFGKGIRSGETFHEIYWRVYVKHQPGWEGNPKKFARATSLAGRDWSQGLIAHVWGGNRSTLAIDPATGVRDSRKVTVWYNDFFHLRWLGLKRGQAPIFHPSESGRWVVVESRVKVNTPGRADGVFQLWIDGKLDASRTGLDWHGSWDEYAINAVFLENYWDEGAIKREARWFDDFVISTKPIGPIVAKTPVAVARTGANVAGWEAEAATDAEGKDVVWRSKVIDGKLLTLTVDAGHGKFSGSRSRQTSLAPGAVHWIRLRDRAQSGEWSAWTAWHAPFRTPSG